MPRRRTSSESPKIAQEAVNNAMRHGKPSQVTISLKRVSTTECELQIKDNGTGIKKFKGSDPRGIGMNVMHYRANLIGARLTIKSEPRSGVTVSCIFPCKRLSK